MKRKYLLGLMIGLVAMGSFMGCSKDPASVNLNSDDEAIRQLVEENMDYITSAGVNDDGAQAINYESEGLGKVNGEISPIKFGRRGQFRLEQMTVDYPEDGHAVATVIYSFDGDFFVVAENSTDPNAYGTLYKKEMKNTVTRKAIFRKVANSNNPKQNWKLRGVSGSELRSPDTNLIFSSILIESADSSWTIENPLDFIQDLDSVPVFTSGESVKVFVTVQNATPDTVVLRYRTDKGQRRARKAFVDDGSGADQTAGDGIYSGEWVVGQRKGIYHAFADAFDEGSITDDVADYNALAWGFPYFVKR
jgi:hypothetical protein